MKYPLRPAALVPRSIAFRLILAVLTVELISAILAVALSFAFERHLHFHALDIIMHGHAESIIGSVQEPEDGKEQLALILADIHTPKDDIWEACDESGRMLGLSANWQGITPQLVPMGRGAFAQYVLGGHRYRLIRREGTRVIDPDGHGGGRPHRITVVYGARVKHVWELIWSSVEFYALGSALLLLVTGPLIAWLLHRGLLPLRQLAAMASEVSAHSWHFEPPPLARSTPELAPLTLALESVLQRLEGSFVQQKTFVSDAAHELKTAVAVVKSSLQLLNLKPRTAEEYKTGLERCLSDCYRLEDLVARMLTLAREESAPATSNGQFTELLDCLQWTVEDLETVATVREVRVRLAKGIDAALAVSLSGEDCGLLFNNLLLNALQHSPAGTEIEIRIRSEADGKMVLVEIEDHCEGISPEVLPHVFERFYRGDPSRNRSTGGTGLGLAICRAITERVGGTIRLSSEPGRGATASVCLPRAEAKSAKP